VEEEEPNNIVAGLVHPPEVDQGVDRCGERAVEPATALTNELWCALRNISLGFAVLHVGESPSLVLLCDQLEAEDTILS
jgi:hypothetical protein